MLHMLPFVSYNSMSLSPGTWIHSIFIHKNCDTILSLITKNSKRSCLINMVFGKYSSKSFKTDQTVRANHSLHPTPRYHQFLQFPPLLFQISLNYHLLPHPHFRRRVLSIHQGQLHDWTLHLLCSQPCFIYHLFSPWRQWKKRLKA